MVLAGVSCQSLILSSVLTERKHEGDMRASQVHWHSPTLWYTESMSSTSNSFERCVRPVLNMLLPGKAEEVLNFHPDGALQNRIDALAAKSNEGELKDAEREEYEGYVRANKFIAILQRQARRLLSSDS